MGGGRGVLLVHNEIHYVPIGDGWEEVLVRNVLHYVPVLLSSYRTHVESEYRLRNADHEYRMHDT